MKIRKQKECKQPAEWKGYGIVKGIEYLRTGREEEKQVNTGVAIGGVKEEIEERKMSSGTRKENNAKSVSSQEWFDEEGTVE